MEDVISNFRLYLMGNLITETHTLYALDWTPLKSEDEFTQLSD
jgi:hypothetical protein